MIIEARDLTKNYSQGDRTVEVIKGLQLKVAKGESLAILGPSGSGKSTLLSLLAGLDTPDSGEILFQGQSLTSMSADSLSDVRRDKISMVYQQFHLFKHLTARENVALPLELQNVSGALEKADSLLNEVGLSHRLDHFPSELSGGECQRVAIARALIHRPDLILADEPSGNLDVKTGDQVMELMFKLVKDHQVTLILVTHNPELAAQCDRTLQLS